MTDNFKQSPPGRRLADVVRDVKVSAADRTDVVVDMRDADRARLELLAQELEPVFKDIDSDDDRFDFGISQGLQPRLWVDAVAHVHMGQDRRVFRFVRDTRLGRVVISDTSDVTDTADAVARYIAERVIERERILAGDFESLKRSAGLPDNGEGQAELTGSETAADEAETQDGATTVLATGPDKWALAPEDGEATAAASVPPASAPAIIEETPAKPRRGNSGFALSASWFILGCVAGAAALLAAFWDRLSALLS